MFYVSIPYLLDAVLPQHNGVHELGVALVLVLHDVVEGVDELCDELVVFRPGKQELLRGEELTGKNHITSACVQSERIHLHPQLAIEARTTDTTTP